MDIQQLKLLRILQRVAEVQISYAFKVPVDDRIQVTSSAISFEVFLALWDEAAIGYVEEVKVLLLNRANHVLGYLNLARGGLNSATVDLRVAFAAALKTRASSIILAHNHPTGALRPSQSDRRLTEEFRKAGKVLRISVLDHLIITPQSYYSFADEGLI